MATLEIIHGGELGRLYDVEGARAVVGRSPECDVVLDEAAVSRHHAVITRDAGDFFIEDLGSRNGTFVNGQRIANRAPLREGDRVLICDLTFEFRSREPVSSLAGPQIGDSTLARWQEDEDDESGLSGVMATFDLSGSQSVNWQLSAKPEVKLAALVEISTNLGKTLSVKEILPKILDSLFKIFVQADRGFVVMRPEPDAPLVPVAVKTRRPSDEEEVRISRTIVQQAMDGRKAILSADATRDERFNMAESISDFHIRSLICAPLLDSNEQPLGVIQVDTSNQRSRFNDEDLEVLAGVASQAAIAIDNAKMHEIAVTQRALQRDLELAHRVQRALLPDGPPTVTGYHFFDYYRAANQVGGDYYDYSPLADGRFGVVVADVAGKGVSAALLMARLSSEVRFWLASERDPAKAVDRMNGAFARNDWQDRFVTGVLAVVDPQSNSMTIVNAGHMPPLLRHSGGTVEAVGEHETGLPIGVVEDFEYESYTRSLEPGDFVTLFTDGISEAMNPQRELYGLKRLHDQIGDQAVNVADLGERILEDVRQFVGGHPQSDDMCLACFGRDESATS